MPLTVPRSCFYRAFIELSACLYQSLERAFIEAVSYAKDRALIEPQVIPLSFVRGPSDRS